VILREKLGQHLPRVLTQAPRNGNELFRPVIAGSSLINFKELRKTTMLNTLFANDVRQTLDHFRRSVDQMFENVHGQGRQPDDGDRLWTFSPTLESGWNDHCLNVRAVLPGVEEKDVTVTMQNNQLVIEGERKIPAGYEKNTFFQLPYGKFYSTVALPSGVDANQAKCILRNGMLDIQIPVPESSRPKQIQIQTVLTGQQPKTIAA